MASLKIAHISTNFKDTELKLTEKEGEVILTKLSAFSTGWMKSSLRLDLIPAFH